uniref:Uncharacterized protein n=1 Tax=Escherichia coli TaxID=562 RepID=A0A6H0A7F0_ECOLX|nr:hypothetical protein [Escherichia coli]
MLFPGASSLTRGLRPVARLRRALLAVKGQTKHHGSVFIRLFCPLLT